MTSSKIAFIAESMKKFIRRRAFGNLANLLGKVHPSELADAIEALKAIDQSSILDFLISKHKEMAADMFVELNERIQLKFAEELEPEKLASILRLMNSDDAVAIIEDLPDERKSEILNLIQDTPQVEEQLLYADDTAGRIMTTDYFSLQDIMTVKGAIEQLQKLEEKAEMVFYLYLVDEENRLSGVLSLRQLLVSTPATPLKDIMNNRPISVNVDTDQEEVASLVSQYDLLAIPVVDHDRVLVGIITVDDVIDIIREEAEEDFYRMAGTSEEEILHWGNPWKIVKIRIPWLLPAFLSTFVVASMLDYIKGSFIYFALFVVFMPMINATAGNIGVQSTTIMARELALDRIQENRWAVLLWSQFRIGFIIGLIFGM
ncbi:MAG: magnesium transporter, partial [Holophagae bacterium]|nr:magnesium transporter [Holophagae bacterium]